MTPVRACMYGFVVGLAVWVFAALWLMVLVPESTDVSPLKQAVIGVVIIASSISAGVYVARTRMKK